MERPISMRRLLLPLALLASLLVAPAAAAADPLTSWTPGPDAILDNTYNGSIDAPSMNASVPNGNFTVSGWFVDQQADGWAGADAVQVWRGTMDGGGKQLATAQIALNRPDVASAEGNPYWANSGFSALVPSEALTSGPQTLSVYVHTPGKGWWYRQVQVNVSTSAPASAAATVSGGSPPVVAVEAPNSGTSYGTKQTFTLRGYALDRNAAPNQGSQGTGIDQVSVYADGPRESSDSVFLGNADLAFSDATAQAMYGNQFANAGWRFEVKPTNFHSGDHNLFIYAHSVVTGKEDLVTLGFAVTEDK
jgi:hypothetical protein